MHRYIEGVNTFIKNAPLPVEYKLLRIKPSPFKTEDTIAISGYMSFSFAHSFKVDPLLHFVEKKLGPKYYKDFILNLDAKQGAYHNQAKYALAQASKAATPDEPSALKTISDNFPLLTGSNAWVVSGKRTKIRFSYFGK